VFFSFSSSQHSSECTPYFSHSCYKLTQITNTSCQTADIYGQTEFLNLYVNCAVIRKHSKLTDITGDIFLMTLKTGEDILIWRRRLWIALYGGIVLEEALDLSSERILNEWMNLPKLSDRLRVSSNELRIRLRVEVFKTLQIRRWITLYISNIWLW